MDAAVEVVAALAGRDGGGGGGGGSSSDSGWAATRAARAGGCVQRALSLQTFLGFVQTSTSPSVTADCKSPPRGVLTGVVFEGLATHMCDAFNGARCGRRISCVASLLCAARHRPGRAI